MKRIAIGIANPDGKKPAVHLHRRAGANFSWIPWILKFIENWYSNISKFAGNAKSADRREFASLGSRPKFWASIRHSRRAAEFG